MHLPFSLYAAFVHALNNSERRFYPAGTIFKNEDGSIHTETPKGLKPTQLVTADLEAWKVEQKAHEIKPIIHDPFVNCPVCSLSTKETLNNGKTTYFWFSLISSVATQLPINSTPIITVIFANKY